MLSPVFVVAIGVLICVAVVWFYAKRKIPNDPFLEALGARYGIDDDSVGSIALAIRVTGWKRAGIGGPWLSDFTQVGLDNDSLYITRLSSISKAYPAIKIPLDDLTLVESRFFWAGLLNLDVFAVSGLGDGLLVIQTGAITVGESE